MKKIQSLNIRILSQGFALIELMVAMLIGLVVIGGATTIVLTVMQTYRQTQEVNQLHESIRFVTDILTRDVRGMTDDAELPAEGGVSDTFEMLSDGFSGCEVFSSLPPEDGQLSGALACDDQVLVGGVSGFQVTALGSPVMGYEFMITFRGVEGEAVPVTFRVAMRNKILSAISE